MHIVYAERYKEYAPIIDNRTKEVLDDGTPKRVKLSSWEDKKTASTFAENVKAHLPKRSWRVWIEST